MDNYLDANPFRIRDLVSVRLQTTEYVKTTNALLPTRYLHILFF